jgi:hypothetical protein
MTQPDLDALHRDPAHWKLFLFYICPADPRLVVRKRIGAMGWTLNFGRWMAIPFLCGLIGWIYGCLALLDWLEISDSAKWFGIVFMIFGIVGVCGWLSDSRRYAAR